MGSSTMRAVFDRTTDAFNRHDIEAFKNCLGDDVTLTAPGGVQLRGRDAVGAFYKSWMDGFPDAHVEIREAHTVEDGIVEEGTFSGTHRGTLRTPQGDLTPTGRSVSARYIEVLRIRGEQVTSLDLVYDRLELLEQIGMTQSAGAAQEHPVP